MHKFDFRRSLGPVRGRSEGSFPEQRLIEPKACTESSDLPVTESCSFWYGLKDLFRRHKLDVKVVYDRLK